MTAENKTIPEKNQAETATASLMYKLIMNFPKEKEYLQFPGDFQKIPEGMRKILDGTDIEEISIIRRASHGMNPDFVVVDTKEISNTYTPPQGDQPGKHEGEVMIIVTDHPTDEERMNEWISRIDYEKEWGVIPTETMFSLIKSKVFTITNNGRKTNPALYANTTDISNYLYPIENELKKALGTLDWDSEISDDEPNPKDRDFLLINETVRTFNPYIHTLKKEPEFMNRPIEELSNLILDYFMKQTGSSRNALIRNDQEYNILNPEILKNHFRFFYPCTNKDLQDFIKFARGRIGQKYFLQVPQNKVTNTLISSFVDKPTAGQLDFLNAFETQINSNFILKFENVQLNKDDVTPISLKTTNGMKTLIIFLHEFSERKNKKGDVRISLKEIQNKRDYKNIQTAREQTTKALDELSKIGFRVKDKGKFSGYIRLNGGTHYIKNDVVYWNWNQDFLPIIEKTFISDFPPEGLRTNDKKNPNAFHLTVFLSNSYRMNEGKESEGIVSVSALIDNCPNLKDNLQKNLKIKEKVMIPLITDLNSLEWLNYTWHANKQDAATGNEINNIESLSSKDFLQCYIKVDFSDFTKHPDRLMHKATRKRQLQNKIDNAKAKAIVKKEMEEQEQKNS